MTTDLILLNGEIMYTFQYPDWTKVHTTHWKRLINKLGLDKKPEINIVEVGCFEGRSTIFFLDTLIKNNTSRYFAIDTWEGGEEVRRLNLPFDMKEIRSNFEKNISMHPYGECVKVKIGTSEQGLNSLYRDFKEQVDFIYLDGSHTQKDTLFDLTYAYPLLRKGALLLIDDYKNSMATSDKTLRPRDAVDFFVKTMGNNISFGITSEQQAYIVRN